MRLLVHGGAAKAGSTAAQAWLWQNRSSLSEAGVWVPECLGPHQHLYLPMICASYKPDNHLFSEFGIASEEDLRRFSSTRQRQFVGACKAAASQNYRYALVSSEFIQILLTTDSEICGLKTLLSRLFSSVDILFYVRPQVDAIVSLASTASRFGETITRDWFLSTLRTEKIFDYFQLYCRWHSVFDERLKILPYHQNTTFPREACAFCDLDEADFTAPPRMNKPLSVEAIALINSLDITKCDAVSVGTEHFVDSLPFGNPLSIGKELAEAINLHYKSSNEKIIGCVESLSRGSLEPSWEAYQRPSNLHLLEQPLIFQSQLRSLILQLNSNAERSHELSQEVENLRAILAEMKASILSDSVANTPKKSLGRRLLGKFASRWSA